MKKIEQAVAEYFESNRGETIVHEALGKLFPAAEKEKAEKYLAGVVGRMVTTHSREGLQYERNSDKLRHEVYEQENEVEKKRIAYELAPPVEKEQAMSEWIKEKAKLENMRYLLDKQIQLEAKEELIAKSEKPTNLADLERKPLTAEELIAKISAQEAIVEANEMLLPKIKGKAKIAAAEKAQAGEIKLLEDLKAQLEKLQQAAPEVINDPAEQSTGGDESASVTGAE